MPSCVQIWRVAHVTVSSLLPLAVHIFASSLFRSHDVGAVASVLVASSVHVTVLGTHTLVHSLLAPLIFASLAGLVSLLQPPPDCKASDRRRKETGSLYRRRKETGSLYRRRKETGSLSAAGGGAVGDSLEDEGNSQGHPWKEIPFAKTQRSVKGSSEADASNDSYPRTKVSPNSHSGSTVFQNSHPGSTVSQKSHPGSTVSQKSHPGSTVSQKSHPGSTVSQKTHPGSTVSQNSLPGSTVSQNSYPGSTVSQNSHPGSTVSQNGDTRSTLSQNGDTRSTLSQNSHPRSTVFQNSHPRTAVARYSHTRNTEPQNQNSHPKCTVSQNSHLEIQNQNHPANTETKNVFTVNGRNRSSAQSYYYTCMFAGVVEFAWKLPETLRKTLIRCYTNSTNTFVQCARVDENANDCSEKSSSLLVKPNPDSVSGAFTSHRGKWTLSAFRDSDVRTKRTGSFTNALTPFACTFALALSCYIRPDGVLLVFALAAAYFHPNAMSRVSQHESVVQRAAFCVLGTAAGVVVGVADDFYFYGVGVLSPVNWLKFNVLSNATSQFFGTDSACFYSDQILFGNCGMVSLLGINLFGLAVTAAVVWKERDNSGEEQARWVRKVRLLASVLSLLCLYSLQRHKELRFVHHVIVLYLVFTAANVLSVAMAMARTSSSSISRLAALFLVLFFSWSQWRGFPSVREGTLKHWVYMGTAENYGVTKCLNYIASRGDVTGVFSDKNIPVIGGYTFLRHDVPILTLTFSGYHEYGLSSRTSTDRKLWWGESHNISVVTYSKVSNCFLQKNKQYLLRYLIAHAEYNYLILDTATDFLHVGYKQVFTSESTKVIKRVGTEAEEKRLSDVVPLLELEAGVAVLENEARQLYAFGLKVLAASRFREATKERERRK